MGRRKNNIIVELWRKLNILHFFSYLYSRFLHGLPFYFLCIKDIAETSDKKYWIELNQRDKEED